VTCVGTEYPPEPHCHPEDGGKTFIRNFKSSDHATRCNNQED